MPEAKTASCHNYIKLPRLHRLKIWSSLILIGLIISAVGCGPSKDKAEAESKTPGGAKQENQTAAVDVAIAQANNLRKQIEYTGTTSPVRSVSLRSQAEGQLLGLNVNVGDAVRRGQVVGQLDDAIAITAINQAEAELASRQSEIARARTQVSNARARVEQARLELQQASADSARFQKLLKAGAISAQQAQQAETSARTAAQILRAAQEQVRTEQEAVAAAQGRAIAQQALVSQASKRRAYSQLISPVNGVVLERITEPGNLVQPGNEVLKLGDFSRVKIVVQISELELSKIRVGQSVQVRLDAFPNQKFIGQVARISPAADPIARLVPIEITIPNSQGNIGSGLLARADFSQSAVDRIVVPQTALQPAGEQRSKGGEQRSKEADLNLQNGTIFVVQTAEGKEPTIAARNVILGDRADGKVEILSGLKAGERFVVRSTKPLKDKETVRVSILSAK